MQLYAYTPQAPFRCKFDSYLEGSTTEVRVFISPNQTFSLICAMHRIYVYRMHILVIIFIFQMQWKTYFIHTPCIMSLGCEHRVNKREYYSLVRIRCAIGITFGVNTAIFDGDNHQIIISDQQLHSPADG